MPITLLNEEKGLGPNSSMPCRTHCVCTRY